MEPSKNTPKQCVSCGQYFRPDPRAGARQKSCGRTECRKKRKKLQERAWKLRNPDYFLGFYAAYVKPWRQVHPGYQKRRRCKSAREIKTQIQHVTPIRSMRIHLRCNWSWSKIKTQILRVTLARKSVWVDRC